MQLKYKFMIGYKYQIINLMKIVRNLLKYKQTITTFKPQVSSLQLIKSKINCLVSETQAKSLFQMVSNQVKQLSLDSTFQQSSIISYIYQAKIALIMNHIKLDTFEQAYSKIDEIANKITINFQQIKLNGIITLAGVIHRLNPQQLAFFLVKVQKQNLCKAEIILLMRQLTINDIQLSYEFAEYFYKYTPLKTNIIHHEYIKMCFLKHYSCKFSLPYARVLSIVPDSMTKTKEPLVYTLNQVYMAIQIYQYSKISLNCLPNLQFYLKHIEILIQLSTNIVRSLNLKQCLDFYKLLIRSNLYARNIINIMLEKYTKYKDQSKLQVTIQLLQIILQETRPQITFITQNCQRINYTHQSKQFIIQAISLLLPRKPEIILEVNQIFADLELKSVDVNKIYLRLMKKKMINPFKMQQTRKMLRFMEINYNQLPSIKNDIQDIFNAFKFQQKVSNYSYFQFFFLLFQLYANNGIHYISYNEKYLMSLKIKKQILNKLISLRNQEIACYIKKYSKFNASNINLRFLFLCSLRLNEIVQDQNEVFFENLLKNNIKYVINTFKQQQLIKLFNLLPQTIFTQQQWADLIKQMLQNLYFFVIYNKSKNKYYFNRKFTSSLYVVFKLILNINPKFFKTQSQTAFILQILTVKFKDKLAKPDLKKIFQLVNNHMGIYNQFNKLYYSQNDNTSNDNKNSQSFEQNHQIISKCFLYFQELVSSQKENQQQLVKEEIKWNLLIANGVPSEQQIKIYFQDWKSYFNLLLLKNIEISFQIPKPRIDNINVLKSYLCLVIYQKISRQNDFSLTSFLQKTSFKQVDLTNELEYIKSLNFITFSDINDYRMIQKKFQNQRKYELWNDNQFLNENDEVEGLTVKVNSDKILTNLINGIVGGFQHIEQLCINLQSNSSLKFMLDYFQCNVTNQGALFKLQNSLILSSNKKFHKILCIAAYFLNEKNRKQTFVETNPQLSIISQLSEKIKNSNKQQKKEESEQIQRFDI